MPYLFICLIDFYPALPVTGLRIGHNSHTTNIKTKQYTELKVESELPGNWCWGGGMPQVRLVSLPQHDVTELRRHLNVF